MAVENYKYVVLGGGNSAGYVAKEFVSSGLKPGELAIISDENVCSYERPALSKAYLAPASPARLPGFHTSVGGGGDRQTPEWYTEKGITFKRSTKVEKVDVAKKTLSVAGGDSVTYDTLFVATGAKPVNLKDFNVPGSDLQGLYYLRNESDAATMYKAFQETKSAGGKAVVVGGGYIGMEVAAGLAGFGIPTTIVSSEDGLLTRLFTPKISQFYEKFYADKGIKIIKKSMVTGFEGANGKVTTAIASGSDGSKQNLEASIVVVGVGARPNVELLEGQIETVPKPVGGFKVDGYMRTSNPDVYAIGDVAAFPLKMAGNKLVRQEHVGNARTSAAQAVQAVTGKAAGPYDYLPFFYSRVFNLSWQYWGASEFSEVAHFGDFQAGKFGAYYMNGGKVVGVFLESASPEEQAAAKKVALEQPPAASVADMEAKGISFAMSRM